VVAAAGGGGGSVVVAGGVAVSVGVGDGVGDAVGDGVVDVGDVDGVVFGGEDVGGCVAGGCCVPPDEPAGCVGPAVAVGACGPDPASEPVPEVDDWRGPDPGTSVDSGISVVVVPTWWALVDGVPVAVAERPAAVLVASADDVPDAVAPAVPVAVAVPTTSTGAGGSACGEGDPMTNAATTIPTALIPVTVAARAVSERRSFSQPIEVCRASVTTAPLPAIVRSVDPAAGTGPRSRTSFARRLPCTDSGGPNRSFVGPCSS
jgi:hypothetical protein